MSATWVSSRRRSARSLAASRNDSGRSRRSSVRWTGLSGSSPPATNSSAPSSRDARAPATRQRSTPATTLRCSDRASAIRAAKPRRPNHASWSARNRASRSSGSSTAYSEARSAWKVPSSGRPRSAATVPSSTRRGSYSSGAAGAPPVVTNPRRGRPERHSPRGRPGPPSSGGGGTRARRAPPSGHTPR